MGAQSHNPVPPASAPAWLTLLHLEAEGELTPEQQDILDALRDQAEVQRMRHALAQITQELRTLQSPVLPFPLAALVAQEVRLSAGLRPPPLPSSVAAAVVADLRLSINLEVRPVQPYSVADAVAAEIGAARWWQQVAPLPALPHSVAAEVASEIAGSAQLRQPGPIMPRSVAASVVQRIGAAESQGLQAPTAGTPQTVLTSGAPEASAASPAPGLTGSRQTEFLPIGKPEDWSNAAMLPASLTDTRGRNSAPLLLVAALLIGLLLMAVTTVWPNLAAGALVFQTLLSQVSPLAGLGLGLLLLTSGLVAWNPRPAVQRMGAGAFALAAVLTIPAIYSVAEYSGISFGRSVTVSGVVPGNVIAVGGHVTLTATARVKGEVVTLLGDVRREPGAQVGGRVNALLGHAPGDREALETAPPAGLGMATAAAFRPVLGWLGAAAWPQIFMVLTGSVLLLLFLGGVAPQLARRQRHAPIRTLALGILALAALLGPALGLALAGLLGPALIATALAALLIATGLSVSVYDLGRMLALRVRLPVPDAVGAMIGLSGFAAALSAPSLALVLALIGGTWGTGTLLLTRTQDGSAESSQAA